ncbi:HIT domain-containing protein [Tessaracoccus sp. OS52]|uniref:HIT family protein n=1 Tax=Tessaracoccus sp. OS52 TaxID=2886691 RepID=UPI001D110C13|nr:HIT domain-containing protein [Tessaracoccus sp. OS52]MCC2593159.1 HIT domain-containing protein [Tessaracoccus sp. OS52]
MSDKDCLFCRMVEGQVPIRQIYSDDIAIAFLDISPWQEGHALVVPRRHVVDVLADDEVLAELSPAVVAVGNLLKDKLSATACNILTNAGADSGQEVFHAHVHVIPRYADNPGIANLRGVVEVDLDAVHARINA